MDNDSGVIHLAFNEAVQAISTDADTITVSGDSGGTATNAATGSKSSNTVQSVPIDSSDLGGSMGTLDAPGGIPNFVSTATGLPAVPVAGLRVPISY